MAVLPPRLDPGRAGCAALYRAARVGGSSADRRRRVVELKHHRAQFRPPPLFPFGADESPILRSLERPPRHSANALAGPSHGPPWRRAMAIARLAAACDRDRANLLPVDHAGLARATLFPSRLSSRIPRRAGSVRAPGAL